MPGTLTRRALNRATLDRQLLLRRTPMPAAQAIAHLGGMQAQAPLAPYVGLWTRLAGFTADELSTLISERTVVRAHLMRSTVHLLTAQDYVGFRPLYVRLGERELRAHFGTRLGGVAVAEVRDRARELLAGQPLTRAQLGRLLAPSWPDADPATLAYAASYQLPLIQVPPRGIWGKNGPATWALAGDWLGEPVPDGAGSLAAAERLVLAGIGSFGPMTVGDLQQWSGLRRLAEVTQRLGDRLLVLRGEDGAELLDLPDAPRPGPDVPAPPRFLPEYDNLLLSHADRSRVIPHGRPVPLPPGNGASRGTLLVDGDWQGIWRIDGGVLEIRPFGALSGEDTGQIEAEGGRLLAFAAATAGVADIRFASPALR